MHLSKLLYDIATVRKEVSLLPAGTSAFGYDEQASVKRALALAYYVMTDAEFEVLRANTKSGDEIMQICKDIETRSMREVLTREKKKKGGAEVPGSDDEDDGGGKPAAKRSRATPTVTGVGKRLLNLTIQVADLLKERKELASRAQTAGAASAAGGGGGGGGQGK